MQSSSPPPVIQTRTVEYHGDGLRMLGYLAVDPARAGLRPAVLVAHEAPGLDDFNRERCRKLAELGYTAFAIDYHGEGEIIADRAVITARMQALAANPQRLRARVGAALDALRAQSRIDVGRIAAIGYCFGGTVVLELARSGADIAAVAAFHAGLGTARADDAKHIRAKILVCNGVADPIVPLEQRVAFEREMEQGGVDWQLHVYGGTGHAYTRPAAAALGIPGFAYNPEADQRSWQSMLALFDATLGAP